MNSLPGAVAIFAALIIGSTAIAEDEYPVAAEEFVYCTVCHGAQLMGNATIRAPRLSRMESWYVERQLQAFKKGWRGVHTADEIGMEMQPMAVVLTDEQIVEVSEFVSKTTSDQPESTIAGNAGTGRTLYAPCSACHGQNAEGNRALGGPALTGLNDWYLVEQLRKYRAGSRGHDPQDTYGTQMRAAAQTLTDDDAIRDVVSYINTLQTK